MFEIGKCALKKVNANSDLLSEAFNLSCFDLLSSLCTKLPLHSGWRYQRLLKRETTACEVLLCVSAGRTALHLLALELFKFLELAQDKVKVYLDASFVLGVLQLLELSQLLVAADQSNEVNFQSVGRFKYFVSNLGGHSQD